MPGENTRRTWVRFPLGMNYQFLIIEIWLLQEETFSYQNWYICNTQLVYIFDLKMLNTWNVNEDAVIFWSHQVESAIPIAYSAWWNHQEDVGSIPTGDELSISDYRNLIIHPQWESNPRPPGVFTRHYKLWEWHFQLHDFRKSLHPHWHFMRQHFQIKYIIPTVYCKCTNFYS